MSRIPYPSDVSDEQWALIEPVLAAWRARRVSVTGPNAVHALREILDAILYVNRTGCAWAYLPHDFPPAKTVYDYFAKWRDDGTLEALHAGLRAAVRRSAGRDPAPTAVVIDSQSVKTSVSAPADTVGFDPGKKIKGRKRHVAVDTLGLLVVAGITAASGQDHAVGVQVLSHVAAVAPTVTKAWADAGYRNAVIEHGADLGIDVEIVRRPVGFKGFAVLQRRWVVERTFGWLMLHRRLTRDYETKPLTSRAMILWAMIGVISRRLTGQVTQTWRY